MDSKAQDDGPLYPDGSDADGFPGGDQRMGGDRRVAQVGGTHYQAAYQHWDWAEDIGMGYLEGCASKYLCRWRDKDGLKDLKKSRSYVEKLILVGRGNRVTSWDYPLFNRYCDENGITGCERDATLLLYNWSRVSELSTVVDIIQTLIAKNFPEEFQAKVGGDPSWNADISL